MKTLFFHNHNNVLNDTLNFYKLTDNLLLADAYITWNDLVDPQKRVIQLAKEYGKPSIVVEHGMKAVSDYQVDMRDIVHNMGGKDMIADIFCCWGNKSQSILLEAGIKQDRIRVIGSPIAWEHDYHYVNKRAKKHEASNQIVKFFGGEQIIDPTDGAIWELEGCHSYIPTYDKGKIISYFPGHNYDKYTIKQVQKVYDQIKDEPNLFIVLADSYVNSEEDNPFRDIIDMKDDRSRREKAIVLPPGNPKNMMFIKALLKRTKIAITTIPGTINGVCWAMNVPTIVPEIDWHWRDLEGKVIYDIHDADYRCDEDKIKEEIQNVLENDSKGELRTQFAIEFMGIDCGSPTTNLRDIIDKL